MSAIIEKIELENWFVYKGKYKENIIEFGEGLNVIVGDNNGGKTKLQNAIRYIIEGQVVLKNKDQHKKSEINESNILEVLNQRTYNELKLDETAIVGVKLYFNKETQGEKRRYLLKKEIKIRKTVEGAVEGAKIMSFASDVYIVNKNSGAEVREKSNEYRVYSDLLMPPKSKNYFFLDGEQLGLMTPLEGPELKNTINSISKLNKVDETVDVFIKVLKTVTSKKNEILEATTEESDELKEMAELLNELPEQIEKQDKSIEDINNTIVTQTELKENYEDQAKREEDANKILKDFTKLAGKKDIAEEKYVTCQRNFISSYLDSDLFYLAYLNDDTEATISISSYLEEIKEFVTARKTELDNTITAEESKMMNALDRSQPKPAILKDMVKEKKCYVCAHDLNADSISWIENKLIPFFSKEDSKDEDIELKKLISIKEFTSQIFNSARTNLSKNDPNKFSIKTEDIVDALNSLNEKKKDVTDFIEANGEPDGTKKENVALITYKEAIEKIQNSKIELTEANDERKKMIADQTKYTKKLTDASTGKSKLQLEKINDLDTFLSSIKQKLEQIKAVSYTEFGKKLSLKATERFQNFFKRSKVTSKQEIKVDLIPKVTTKGNDYDFKISVVNSFGENQKDAGNASQAMRQLAVVFGLIDLSGTTSCPFIVDAPTSDLSPPQTASFFEQIGNDEALRQTILLTMDLYDDNSKKLNSLGENVLLTMQAKSTNKFMILEPKGENNGVEITDLKK